MAAVLRASNQLWYYVVFVCVFCSLVCRCCFCHCILLQKKKLLDIRTAITHLGLDQQKKFNKQEAQDILRTPDKANIPIIGKRKRRRYRGHRAGCLVRIRRRQVGKLPLLSILLANVQSLDNKLDEVRSRISYQLDIKNCNSLCFMESWLNDDMDIQLAGYTLHRQDRTALSGKTTGGGLCIFVTSWCMKFEDVSRLCSPDVEYIVINYRPHTPFL